MTKEQWELYKEFCEFSGLQDNSDAKLPNCCASLKMYFNKTGIEDWDTIDDPSIFSPEMLTYVVLKAKEFWQERLREANNI